MKNMELSPEILRALESLERASSHTDLGPAYQVLLDWRRRHPARVFSRNLLIALPALALFAIVLWVLPRLDVPVTDFSRGFILGACVVSIIYQLTSGLRPSAPAPLSIETRIEAAIDRWRHVVPAMREIPR
jgi:hypothetical protein